MVLLYHKCWVLCVSSVNWPLPICLAWWGISETAATPVSPHCPGFEQILCYLEELTQRFQETEDGDRGGDHVVPCTGRYWADILYLFALTWVFFSTSWDSFESIVVPFVKSVLAFLNWIHLIIVPSSFRGIKKGKLVVEIRKRQGGPVVPFVDALVRRHGGLWWIQLYNDV